MVAQLLLCNTVPSSIDYWYNPRISLSPSIRNHGRTWSISAASNVGARIGPQPWALTQPGAHKQQLEGHQGAS